MVCSGRKNTKRYLTKTCVWSPFDRTFDQRGLFSQSLAQKTRADASRGTRGVVERPRFRRHALAVDHIRRVRRQVERRLKADPEPRDRFGFQISAAESQEEK